MRPGWLVALSAAILAVSVWLPWLTTSAEGGGRANAVGGTAGSVVLPQVFSAGQLIVLLASMLIVAGAMVGRGISARWAAGAGLVISLLIAALTGWYYNINVNPPLSVGYGFYVGAVGAVLAVAFSLWAVVAALTSAGGRR